MSERYLARFGHTADYPPHACSWWCVYDSVAKSVPEPVEDHEFVVRDFHGITHRTDAEARALAEALAAQLNARARSSRRDVKPLPRGRVVRWPWHPIRAWRDAGRRRREALARVDAALEILRRK